MDVVANNYMPGDPRLIDQIVYELKSQGIFDQFRKECISDVDTKPAYQNLRQRVEGSVTKFLNKQCWSPDMNKNQVREQLRKTIQESGYLESGVERIVDQVVNPKINTVFLPKIEEIVYKFLGIEKPNKSEPYTSPDKKPLTVDVTDLLPHDLEAVSPESVTNDIISPKVEDSVKTEPVKDDSLNSCGSSSKADEDESPPFEPLDEPLNAVPNLAENSGDSNLSGFSGLASHDSNHSFNAQKNNTNPPELNTDTLLSQNSSEGRLSIVTSEGNNSKMEVSEDSQENPDLDKFEEKMEVDEIVEERTETIEAEEIHDEKKKDDIQIEEKVDDKKDKKQDKHKSSRRDKYRNDDKKSSNRDKDSSSRDKDSSSRDKDSSRGEKDKTKDTKSGKDKDHRSSSSSKHSISKDKKDHSSSSVRDKEKSEKDKERKDKTTKPKESSDKERSEKHKDKEKSDKDKSSSKDKDRHDKDKTSRDKERSRSDKDKSKEKDDKYKDKKSKTSSSSSSHVSGSKERTSSSSSVKDKKEDKDKSRSSSSHSHSIKDKDKNKSNGTKDSELKKSSSSNSSDKHKKHDKDKHSSSHSSSSKHSSSNKKDKDKKSSKDDHYSSKEKKTERRSTDRDSNDGSGKMSRNSSFAESSGGTSNDKNNGKQSSFSSGTSSGDSSGNSDQKEGNHEQNELSSEITIPVTTSEVVQKFKYIKPKFASNMKEAMKLMKIRKELGRLERQNQLAIAEATKENGLQAGTVKQDDTKQIQTIEEPEKKKEEPPIVEEEPELQSTDLTTERWEELEAKLAQEMSFANSKSYYGDEDDIEYTNIEVKNTGNMKKIDENLKTEIGDNDLKVKLKESPKKSRKINSDKEESQEEDNRSDESQRNKDKKRKISEDTKQNKFETVDNSKINNKDKRRKRSEEKVDNDDKNEESGTKVKRRKTSQDKDSRESTNTITSESFDKKGKGRKASEEKDNVENKLEDTKKKPNRRKTSENKSDIIKDNAIMKKSKKEMDILTEKIDNKTIVASPKNGKIEDKILVVQLEKMQGSNGKVLLKRNDIILTEEEVVLQNEKMGLVIESEENKTEESLVIEETVMMDDHDMCVSEDIFVSEDEQLLLQDGEIATNEVVLEKEDIEGDYEPSEDSVPVVIDDASIVLSEEELEEIKNLAKTQDGGEIVCELELACDSELLLKLKQESDNVLMQENEDSDVCRYLEKPTLEEEEKLQRIYDFIGMLEKNVEELSLKIHNNIPKVGENSIGGRKRKIVEDTKNNNEAVKRSRQSSINSESLPNSNLCKNSTDDISPNESFSLPLSPADSDGSIDGKKETSPELLKTKRKSNRVPVKKRQCYSSDDLYKPRPVFSVSSRRSRTNVAKP